MSNIFYLHPAKCGGNSVERCMIDLGIKYFRTADLVLSRDTLDVLKSDPRTIVFGHIGYLIQRIQNENKDIAQEILHFLYHESSLVMPTRNPSNLLQSWMHYSKTRSNKILSCVKQASDIYELPPKDLGMLANVTPLNQEAVKLGINQRGRINEIIFGADFPLIDLKSEDEEYNLLRFADYLMTDVSGGIAQLCSMQAQLFALKGAKIKSLILRGKKVFNKLPVSGKERIVFYYDCENIGRFHQKSLDLLMGDVFSEKLIGTVENKSADKPVVKGSEFQSVNDKLESVVPGEWQIYMQSKLV